MDSLFLALVTAGALSPTGAAGSAGADGVFSAVFTVARVGEDGFVCSFFSPDGGCLF